MKKRTPAFVFLFVCVCLLFAACQARNRSTETALSAEKPTVKFYGKIVEYSSGEPIATALTEALKDKYKVECLQVDWGNLDQVIRTGIASGQPCDIYNYWTQSMNSYIQDGMALDLASYLDENNGAWRKTFNPNLLKIAEFDGKVYNIPITSNFPTILVNVDLFKQAGIEVPQKWTWDEFLSVCKRLKDKGIFPFANPTDNQKQDWFFSNGVLSLGKDKGLLEDLADGKVPCTDPLFREALNKTKDLYDKGYMYPGEGAVSLTTDESRAAFSQGRVAISAEVAAGIVSLIAAAPFEIMVVEWPSMGSESVTMGGCDGLFIPSNAADPAAAVAVLKEYTSAKIQQINIDNGFAVAIDTVNVEDETLKSVMAGSSNVYPYEFKFISPELNDYVISQLLAELVLGSGTEACIRQMESLRQIAAAK
jgi:ABC-type glycerol-3-phosphate transport system substrate-binding protein